MRRPSNRTAVGRSRRPRQNPLRPRAAAVIGVGLLVLSAWMAAAEIAEFDVVCPLFGHRFTAEALVTDSEFSAFDSDFCKRSRGQSPYILAVWTCPYCFFSAYQADFRSTVDPRFRDMELRRYPVDADAIQQHEIFVSTKYFNAETYYLAAGRDARFLADLTLRGSYACRVLQMRELPELDALRQALVDEVLGGEHRISVEEVNLALAEHLRRRLESDETAKERRDVYRYLLADALRQAGERLEAKAIFDDLVEERRLPNIYVQNARQRSFLCTKEGEFQEKTLEYLRKAEEQGLIPDAERARVAYLRAELHRRLGNAATARGLFHAAAEIPTDETWLAAMIDKQLARLPAAEPGETPEGG